jgi:hypothetical protein
MFSKTHRIVVMYMIIIQIMNEDFFLAVRIKDIQEEIPLMIMPRLISPGRQDINTALKWDLTT